MPCAKPGKTNPQLPPEAFQATCLVSSTATDQPRRPISRAIVRPANPAPTTHASTSRSTVSRGRSGAWTAVAAYQLVSLIRLRPLLYPPPRRLKRVHARLRRAIAARGRDKDTFISLSGPTRTLRLDFLRRKIDV